MTFELWGIDRLPYFGLPTNLIGYLVLGAYVLFLVAAVVTTWRDFRKLTSSQWMLFGALVVASPVLINMLRLRFPGMAAPPGVPIEPPSPTLTLLGYTPILLAAGLLGTGPALAIGLVAGLARAGWETYQITTAFETALAAWLVSWLMRQDYRDFLPRLIRFPPAAAFASALAVWPLSYFSSLAYLPGNTAAGLTGLDFASAQWWARAVPLFGELLIAGVIAVLARAAFPRSWAPRVGARPPPYASSLNNRLLFTLFPLSFAGLLVLFWASTSIANSAATSLIAAQMGGDAQSVSNSIPYFIQTGQSILTTMAADEQSQQTDPALVERWLKEQIQTIAFFNRLSYLDPTGTLIATYPPSADAQQLITLDEQSAVQSAVPQTLTIYPTAPANGKVEVSFVVPVVDAQSGVSRGALVGRAQIDGNPLLKPALSQLAGLTADAGQGLIVDERGTIIYDSSQSLLLQTWAAPEANVEKLQTTIPNGTAFRDRSPGNTRQLVFSLPVAGYPWTVVVILPNEVVLAQATYISTPTVFILMVIGILGGGVMLWVTRRITQPIATLARATASIAQGEFDRPVGLSGEDEVGRLGVAFERMRERLRARIGELNLLLRVSQGIAGSLNLDQSLPSLLSGALTAVRGDGVRLVSRTSDDSPPVVFADGPLSAAMAPLDGDLLALTESDGRIVLENIARARTVLNVNKTGGQVQSLIALPLRQEAEYIGMLWIGFSQPHPFTESEVNFLSTLAGQAAMAVTNAHLYEASEGGRQQLQAILASSPDAVIVIDRRERVLLLNPAAESVFGVPAHSAHGRPLAEVISRPELLELIRNPQMAASRQVPLADGRTLYASASPIVAADGAYIGLVAVLRDVTYFKQLDELKSEFVATVSHDLRVPLTFMRGYATMLPMVGQLNAKQNEFAGKIVLGIEQMSELIDDVLDLNRVEAGVGLARESCNVADLVTNAIGNLRNNASNKDIAITVQIAPDLPPVSGDGTLLRQAISNLVDNAIKYTPAAGRVRVSAELREQSIIIAVQDSGIGIAPGDQARLFEKFFRVRQRDNAGIKGSGLGLAIVKSIIDRHDGRVWVDSRLGQGSTFYIALPA